MNKYISNILDSPIITCIVSVSVWVLLLGAGLSLLSFNNPTTTYEKQITVSERQILGSILIRNYYVVTPDNIWYECNEYNNTWNQLQPGHTYNVQIRTSSQRSWLYNSNMNEKDLNITKEIDKATNIYNREMIVGVDGKI